MVNTIEKVISGIMAGVRQIFDKTQMQLLENVIREELHGYKLEKECTELSTKMDDNLYMLQIFAGNKKLEGCKENSIEQYVRSNKNFLEWCNKNYKDITKNDVKMYLVVYGKGKKQNTIANMKRYLSTFYTWAHDEGYIQNNPVKSIKGIRPVEVETKFLTVDEEVAVRDVAEKYGKRDRAIIDLLFSTGLRVGEVLALNRNDIDFRDGSITFRGEKSNRFRTVYLDVRAKRHLTEYFETRKDNNEALFITNRLYRNVYGIREERRMCTSAYEKLTKGVCKAAGITDKECTVHVFRKTFATRLAERGCPLEVIQELLGHADAGTTSRHYVAKSKQHIKRVCERYLLAV